MILFGTGHLGRQQRRPGFEWDVGVHYIGRATDPDSEVRRIFDHLSEGNLRWASMPAAYERIVLGAASFEFVAGEERLRERLTRDFPHGAGAIRAYLQRINSAVRWSRPFFVERAVPRPVAALLGRALRAPLSRFYRRTTGAVLSELTTDPVLRGVLAAQWPDYGLPPGQSSFAMHAIVAHHYLEGGSYPVGGASRLAATMIPAIEARGGRVVVNADVGEVLLRKGAAVGVRLHDGREVRSAVVVSDAGASNTYMRLLPPEVPSVEHIRRALSALPPSSSHLCLYVGLDGETTELGLTGSNLWIYPGEDHDLNVRRFLEDHEQELPVVFISFPSAKDPSFRERFPGRSTIDVITLAPYDWFRSWEQGRWRRRGESYGNLKERFTARLLDVLYKHVPAARGRVLHAELSTPLSTRHFANYASGEIYGLAHTPERFAARWLQPRTPVPGLFLTGQDASVGGVMGAVSGGILAGSLILGRNLFSALTRPFQPR
jgi:all-trans-retinol 13,14-reductase